MGIRYGLELRFALASIATTRDYRSFHHDIVLARR